MSKSTSETNFFNHQVTNAQGQKIDLTQFKGHPVLVVNVASKCGFTPQYTGLEQLYQQFKNQGLVILGFPCNQFGSQEPGNNEEIQQFCSMNYSVTFPVLAKIDVNGEKADPIYMFLKKEAPGILGTEMIKWNFTKFLITPEGKVFKRYAPNVAPQDIAQDISTLLSQ
jgi:glutathione peroxidase